MAFNLSTVDYTNQALFKMQFDKIPNLTYLSYNVTIPGISLGEITIGNQVIDYKVPGDKLTYEPLVLNFIVQENLKNWIEIHDWLTGLGHPNETAEYKRFVEGKAPGMHPSARTKTEKQNKYGDAQLFILSNKLNPIIKVTFIDAWPVSLSPLTYDASMTNSEPTTCDVTMNYTNYRIESLT